MNATHDTGKPGRAAPATIHARFVHADAHFRMGSAHEGDGSPCQDYALAEPAPDAPFAVLSDGCSQSGRTDIGARLLALGARKLLRDQTLSGHLGDAALALRLGVVAHAWQAASALGLDCGDLDATLGVAQALPAGGARAFLFGDGVVAARRGDVVEAAVADWSGNMPGYLSYLMDPARYDVFRAESEAAAKREGRAAYVVEHFRIGPDGQAQMTDREARGATDGLRGLCLEWPDGPQAPDVVALASDGVFQVSGIAWAEVVADFMAIKSARQGSFVTRRMTRALSGFAKRGGRPADDIAMAALAVAAPR